MLIQAQLSRLAYLGMFTVILQTPLPGSATLKNDGLNSLVQQVAATVRASLNLHQSVEVLAGEIQLLRPDTPLPGGAHLELLSSAPGPEAGEWWLRLQCSTRRHCLPFYAVLHSRLARRCCTPPISRAATDSLERPGVGEMRSRPLVHAGDLVNVVEERSGLHLTIPAVCLQKGSRGETIRVRNTFSHTIIRAVVASSESVQVK